MRRVAVPCVGEQPVWPGHRPTQFLFFDVCLHTGRVLGQAAHAEFPSDEGALSAWLDEQGVDCVVAPKVEDMLHRALAERGIATISGQFGHDARTVVEHHLRALISSGQNVEDYAARYR